MTAIGAWADEFATLVQPIGPRFARAEARRHAADFLRRLLGRTTRKNGWQLAEAVGEVLLGWAVIGHRAEEGVIKSHSCKAILSCLGYL